MLLMSACQLSAKSSACALAAVESYTTVAAYLGIELAVYFFYKLIRRDTLYWFPVYGVIGISMSVGIRIGFKVITDFTGNIHIRHPLELGGVYFAFTLLSMPGVYFYFGLRYLNYVENEAISSQLPMVLGSSQGEAVSRAHLRLQSSHSAYRSLWWDRRPHWHSSRYI